MITSEPRASVDRGAWSRGEGNPTVTRATLPAKDLYSILPRDMSMKPPVQCQGPVGITRRNMLQIGTIGALNLALPQVLAARERLSRKGQSSRADSCILVFLNGGPSHLDMWDMKPSLP